MTMTVHKKYYLKWSQQKYECLLSFIYLSSYNKYKNKIQIIKEQDRKVE